MDERAIIELDIRGQICPSCLLQTLKAVNENSAAIRTGRAEVVVSTDDRQAVSTIPDATAKMGYQSTVERTGDGYRIRVYGR